MNGADILSSLFNGIMLIVVLLFMLACCIVLYNFIKPQGLPEEAKQLKKMVKGMTDKHNQSIITDLSVISSDLASLMQVLNGLYSSCTINDQQITICRKVLKCIVTETVGENKPRIRKFIKDTDKYFQFVGQLKDNSVVSRINNMNAIGQKHYLDQIQTSVNTHIGTLQKINDGHMQTAIQAQPIIDSITSRMANIEITKEHRDIANQVNAITDMLKPMEKELKIRSTGGVIRDFLRI